VVGVQVGVEGIASQVGRVLRHQLGVVMLGFAREQPADMGPPGAFAGRMGIARLVRILMMDAMSGYPKDGSAFERERAAESQEIFERPGKLIRTVRVQPVIAHADAQSDADPVQQKRDNKSVPAEHKQCSNGARVQNNQNRNDGPVQFAVFVDGLNVASQEVSLKCPNP